MESAIDHKRIEQVNGACFINENISLESLRPFLVQRKKVAIRLRECFHEEERKTLEEYFDYINMKIKEFLYL